jgi:hypothetical protein
MVRRRIDFGIEVRGSNKEPGHRVADAFLFLTRPGMALLAVNNTNPERKRWDSLATRGMPEPLFGGKFFHAKLLARSSGTNANLGAGIGR